MRGIYGAGVLDVLLENDIKADGLIGVSAGAIHGCSFVSGQKGRSIRYNLKYSRDPRYMSMRSLIRTGDMFGIDFCYRELPETLDPFDNETFESSSTEYYVTCTDVETGQPVYHRCPIHSFCIIRSPFISSYSEFYGTSLSAVPSGLSATSRNKSR